VPAARQGSVRRVVAGCFIVALLVPVAAPADAASPKAERVMSIARRQVGSPWALGRTGPAAFDCSGLVHFAFRRAGALKRVGGQRRSAAGYWRWFRSKGRASRNRARARPGDLVVWGRGTHVGIYVGRGRAVSALNSGVRVHGIHALNTPFTAYLHVRYPTATPKPAPAPKPTPPPGPEPTPQPTPTPDPEPEPPTEP
jgi:hypothetical protein